MKLSDILHNEHFVRLCVPIRVVMHAPAWRKDHANVPFWFHWERLSRSADLVKSNPTAFLDALRILLEAIAVTTPVLRYRAEDYGWLCAVTESDDGYAAAHMFLAYASGADSFITPAEAERYSGTPENTWRVRAADGNLPGAVKKGKQWLLPVSVMRYVFNVSIPADAADMMPLVHIEPEPEISEEDHQLILGALNQSMN